MNTSKLLFLLLLPCALQAQPSGEGLETITDTSKYGVLPHLAPVSQGMSGTCWSFAATSLLESEILRTSGREVKLSEMYFVYHEYIERIKAWVEKDGDVYVEEGSESNALVRLVRNHGMMSREAWDGKKGEEVMYDHRAMVRELLSLLEETRGKKAARPGKVLPKAVKILQSYMGVPPDSFLYEGRYHTPVSFAGEMNINLLDYVSFMSTNSLPWYQKGELVEPDNWWHNDDYYNLPPDEFVEIVEDALRRGYTVCICGDVSEPGYDRSTGIATVPVYDIPADFIDADAREMRFRNGATTDDHCMHAVGVYTTPDGARWFLLKDSNRGSAHSILPGYRFVREDYVKLKMMNLLLYKLGAAPVLDNIIK